LITPAIVDRDRDFEDPKRVRNILRVLFAWHCDTRGLISYARNVTQHLLNDSNDDFVKDSPLAMHANVLVFWRGNDSRCVVPAWYHRLIRFRGLNHFFLVFYKRFSLAALLTVPGSVGSVESAVEGRCSMWTMCTYDASSFHEPSSTRTGVGSTVPYSRKKRAVVAWMGSEREREV